MSLSLKSAGNFSVTRGESQNSEHQNESKSINCRFDELAWSLAHTVTRRGTLEKFALGLAAGIMSWLSSDSVVAQEFPAWSAPVNLGASINTPYSEWHCAISGDGLTIFFISNRPGGFGGTDLWVAQRTSRNADWAPAQNLGPALNTSADEFTPELSPDGHWLFFSSLGLESKNTLQIYAAFRSDLSDNLGWTPPINVGKGVNANHPNGDPSVFIDPQTGMARMYFARQDRGQDDWNIYESAAGADGTFGDAVPVPELNTRFRETHPTVRRDALEVIFARPPCRKTSRSLKSSHQIPVTRE